MDRVPAYEAVDRGSTPLGHTKKMRTAILLFYVQKRKMIASWHLNTGEWWNW